MELSIEEGNLKVAMSFVETEDKLITPEEVLIGAYDVMSRIFGQKSVIRACHRTDLSTMDLLSKEEWGEDNPRTIRESPMRKASSSDGLGAFYDNLYR